MEGTDYIRLITIDGAASVGKSLDSFLHSVGLVGGFGSFLAARRTPSMGWKVGWMDGDTYCLIVMYIGFLVEAGNRRGASNFLVGVDWAGLEIGSW